MKNNSSHNNQKINELFFDQNINKAVTSLGRVEEKMEVAEGVNIYKVNVEKPIRQDHVDETGHILMLRAPLSQLTPSHWYIRLMGEIGIKKEDCIAELYGFTKHLRESNFYTFYPDIRGGSYNPLIKHKSNKSSASRRLKQIEILSRIVKQKVFLNNINLTFPKEISIMLLEDSEGVEKIKQCVSLFMKRKFGKDHSYFSNIHFWSSDNPLKPHAHAHTLQPNFKLIKQQLSPCCNKQLIHGNKKWNCPKCKKRIFIRNIIHKHKFVRTQPLINSPATLKADRILWSACMKEILNLGSSNGTAYGDYNIDPEKVNIWVKYLDSFEADDIITADKEDESEQIQKKRLGRNGKHRSIVLHNLKYCTRSYLCDLGKYFDLHDQDKEEVEHVKNWEVNKENFKKLISKNVIKNRTYTYGYLTRLKDFVREFDTPENNLWFRCYLNKDEKLTLSCPITAEKMQRINKKFDDRGNDFRNIKDLNIYIAYKTKIVKLSTWKFRKEEENTKGKNGTLF
jgi:hypothetical protein